MSEIEAVHPKILEATKPLLEKMRQREEEYKKRHTKYAPTKNDIRNMHEYFDKVHAPTRQHGLKSVYSKHYKTFDYDQVRRMLFKIAVKKARLKGKRFQINTDLERWIWQQSLKWLTFQDDCAWSLNKDLILFGKTGVGKTFLAECLVDLANELQSICHPMDKWLFDWNFIELNTLYEDCVQAKSFSPIQVKTTGNWIFDELGNEKLSIKIYSNEIRFFERIITKREAGKHPKRAIYISNHGLNDLLNYYDSSRFESRFRRLIEDEVCFKGEDKRVSKNYNL